ncbi:hypothetical protein BD779DRAFT_1581616 [Infundibulicybe gibba]|nr:hypothetical protein BD779DRAFT_1581616 [Infundibulicybe gibba]
MAKGSLSPIVPTNASDAGPPVLANEIHIPPADNEPEPVECRWCQKPMTKASRWRHEEGCQKNPNRGEPRHRCPGCDKLFRRKDAMNRHWAGDGCPHPCPVPSTSVSRPLSSRSTHTLTSTPATHSSQSDPTDPSVLFRDMCDCCSSIMAQPGDYRLSDYSSLSGALLEGDGA